MCAWNNHICTGYYTDLNLRVTGILQLLLPCFVVYTPSKTIRLYYINKINFVQVFITMCALSEVKGMWGYYDRKTRNDKETLWRNRTRIN